MRRVGGKTQRSRAAHLLYIDVGGYFARLQPRESNLRSIRRKGRVEFHPRITGQWDRSQDGRAALTDFG